MIKKGFKFLLFGLFVSTQFCLAEGDDVLGDFAVESACPEDSQGPTGGAARLSPAEIQTILSGDDAVRSAGGSFFSPFKRFFAWVGQDAYRTAAFLAVASTVTIATGVGLRRLASSVSSSSENKKKPTDQKSKTSPATASATATSSPSSTRTSPEVTPEGHKTPSVQNGAPRSCLRPGGNSGRTDQPGQGRRVTIVTPPDDADYEASSGEDCPSDTESEGPSGPGSRVSPPSFPLPPPSAPEASTLAQFPDLKNATAADQVAIVEVNLEAPNPKTLTQSLARMVGFGPKDQYPKKEWECSGGKASVGGEVPPIKVTVSRDPVSGNFPNPEQVREQVVQDLAQQVREAQSLQAQGPVVAQDSATIQRTAEPGPREAKRRVVDPRSLSTAGRKALQKSMEERARDCMSRFDLDADQAQNPRPAVSGPATPEFMEAYSRLAAAQQAATSGSTCSVREELATRVPCVDMAQPSGKPESSEGQEVEVASASTPSEPEPSTWTVRGFLTGAASSAYQAMPSWQATRGWCASWLSGSAPTQAPQQDKDLEAGGKGFESDGEQSEIGSDESWEVPCI